ncbi:hypothetical protein B0H14DRAFT_1690097 [Mycena olivaceomarginata]|nr:hypothetical protein B0H14DRAFT_1690097 [Mycena olivaceomarginata]
MRQLLIPILVTMLISGATSLPTQNNNGRDTLEMDISVNIINGTLKLEEDFNLTLVQDENAPAKSSSVGVSASALTVSHPCSSLGSPFPPIGGATLTSKSASATPLERPTPVTTPAAASTCPPCACQSSPTESESSG